MQDFRETEVQEKSRAYAKKLRAYVAIVLNILRHSRRFLMRLAAALLPGSVRNSCHSSNMQPKKE